MSHRAFSMCTMTALAVNAASLLAQGTPTQAAAPRGAAAAYCYPAGTNAGGGGRGAGRAGGRGAGRGSARPTPDYSAPADAPYTAENVTIPTKEGHTLAGTLTLPKGASRSRPVGVLVTMTGTGLQARDGLFKLIADTLGRRGVGLLRMDDRGFGQSTGQSGATTWEIGDDVRAALAYLRTRPEVDPMRLGAVGHSEGAIIMPIVATKEPDIHGIILLASSGKTGRAVLEYQQANLRSHCTNFTQAQKDSALAEVPAQVAAMRSRSRWYSFFLDYDPAVRAAEVRDPAVLVLTGSTDQQATPDAVPVLEAAFKSAGNKDVTAKVLPNLNHLFNYDPDGFPGNYAQNRTGVSKEMLGIVADWTAARFVK